MKNNFTINNSGSADLRFRLEDHLVCLFTNNTIAKYTAMGIEASEVQIIAHGPDNSLMYPQIKLAYHIWSGMRAADRHAVLGKFHSLFANMPSTTACSRKTVIFCALFVHEFASILAEAMEFPD